MTIEKKIIGKIKIGNMRERIEIIMKTHMKTGTARIIIELAIKTKIGINIERCPSEQCPSLQPYMPE